MTTNTDKAIEILRLTNDGSDLAPKHLKLVELACNGFLSPKGENAFMELHRHVSGGYKKPWHCDIKHVTKDHEGFIYWKGIQLEHFSFRSHEDEAKATLLLSVACLHLEATHQEITFANYYNALPHEN